MDVLGWLTNPVNEAARLRISERVLRWMDSGIARPNNLNVTEPQLTFENLLNGDISNTRLAASVASEAAGYAGAAGGGCF